MMKMGKRFFCLLCVVALVLSALWVPTTVSALTLPEHHFDGTDGVYTYFGFEEGSVMSAGTGTTAVDSTGRTFYPVRSASADSNISQETITVNEKGTPVKHTTLRVQTHADPTYIIFTDKNGLPFEAKPNTQYTIRYRAYIKRFGKWTQCFFGVGGYKSDTSDTPALNPKFVDGTRLNQPVTKPMEAKYPQYGLDSCFYQDWGLGQTTDSGTPCRDFSDFSTNNKYQCYEGFQTLTTGSFVVHDSAGNEYNLDKYLGMYCSGSSMTINGQVLPTELYIDYVEIFETGAVTQAHVTVYDGAAVIDTYDAAVGDTVKSAPSLDGKIFAGWYTDAAFNHPFVGEKIDRMRLNLYARYVGYDEMIHVSYYNGTTLLKEQDVQVLSTLWNGRNAVEKMAFAGWYTDAALTTPYLSLNAGTEDLTLYGKFSPYLEEGTYANWQSRPQVLSCYTAYAGGVLTDFAAGGWNYNDVMNLERPDNALTLGNRCKWSQGGGVILYDPETEAMLIPEPSCTYEVTVAYTVEQMDASKLTLSVGYGVNKAYSTGMNGNGAVDGKLIATETAMQTELKTASCLLNIPEPVDENVLPCLVISANITGPADSSNAAPVTLIAIKSVTLKKKTVEGLVFGGVSVMTDEAAEQYNTQGMRVFYKYKLNENGKLTDGIDEYGITERGILVRGTDVSNASLTIGNVGKDGVFGIHKYQNLDECWDYDEATRTVTFSMCVPDLKKDDSRRLTFRGYVVLDNGTVCYTDPSTVSVNDVQCIRSINRPLPHGEKEKLAIMLIIGQSNAQGAGYSEEREIVKVADGLWTLSEEPTVTDYGKVFMSTTGAVSSLSPSNEYSVNYRDTIGGFAPAFAAQWSKQTGERVVILQLAVGATGLAEWQKDANVKGIYKELQYNSGDRGFDGSRGYYLYDRAVEAFNTTYESLKNNFDIQHTLYIWNQGENAERRTDPEKSTIYNDVTYAQYYEKMHNDLMADCPGLQSGTIVAVRSCDSGSNTIGQKNNNTVISGASTNARRAQYRLASKLDNLYMVSWISEECNKTTGFGTNGVSEPTWGGNWDLVPSFKGCSYMFSNMHFTQLRYNQMGKDGAENYYASLNGDMKFDGVAVRDGDYALLGKFGTDGSGSITLTNDGSTKTKFLQIRPESAACTYDFTLHVDKDNGALIIDVYTDGSHPESGDEYVTEFGEIKWDALATDSLTIRCNIH